MRLAIALPTRGRPLQLINTIDRSVDNWRHPNTVMWVMADRDDTVTVDAFLKAKDRWNQPGTLRVGMDIRDREDTIAAKWNRILAIEPDADVYCTDADDAPQITPGYDEKILAAAALFPDGIGCVYGHMANASFTCCEALTKRLADKLGYIFPEYFPYWFVDHWIDDISKMIGRISFADIRTDQSNVGKTQEFREPGWWATWFDAAYMLRREQAKGIIMAPDFQEPHWRKQMLIAQFPLIEYRSRWVNDHVRANERQLTGLLGQTGTDDRYKRVKQRAVDMIPKLLDGLSPQEANAYRSVLDTATIVQMPRAYA